jgi:hypothetical protein
LGSLLYDTTCKLLLVANVVSNSAVDRKYRTSVRIWSLYGDTDSTVGVQLTEAEKSTTAFLLRKLQLNISFRTFSFACPRYFTFERLVRKLQLNISFRNFSFACPRHFTFERRCNFEHCLPLNNASTLKNGVTLNDAFEKNVVTLNDVSTSNDVSPWLVVLHV